MTTSTPDMVRILLQHGANPNSNLSVGKKQAEDSRSSTAQEMGEDSTEKTLIGGENEGTGNFTPLHFICGVLITETGEERDVVSV